MLYRGNQIFPMSRCIVILIHFCLQIHGDPLPPPYANGEDPCKSLRLASLQYENLSEAKQSWKFVLQIVGWCCGFKIVFLVWSVQPGQKVNEHVCIGWFEWKTMYLLSDLLFLPEYKTETEGDVSPTPNVSLTACFASSPPCFLSKNVLIAQKSLLSSGDSRSRLWIWFV